MKTWWSVILGVLAGLLIAGLLWLAASPPRGQAVLLSAPPTLADLTVYVSGAVTHPGVFSLPPGSRVQDAVDAAGGFSTGARQEGINLAALLEDNAQVDVPVVPQTPTASPQPTPDNPFINLNTATQAELESLPGIGQVFARRIIAYRTRFGPFKTVEDIMKVQGITQETFDLIYPYVTVSVSQ